MLICQARPEIGYDEAAALPAGGVIMEWLAHFLNTVLFRLSDTNVTPLALLVMVVTILLAILAGRITRRAVSGVLVRRGGKGHEGTAYAVGRIMQYVVVTTGVLVGLENVGVSLKSLAAFSAVVMVGIGFGLQNIAQNFISGIILLVERPVQKGDFIHVGDTVGTVEEIAMRATRVVTRDGIAIIVPNSELIASRVINRSAPTNTARVLVRVGVAYGTDTRLVRQTLMEVADHDHRVLKQPAPHVFFRDFGESAMIFELAVWIDTPQHEFLITSDLRFAIDGAFRRMHIQIPFPQRELHMRAPAVAASGPVVLPGGKAD
jgi:small-conductance mechanosensitive channel